MNKYEPKKILKIMFEHYNYIGLKRTKILKQGLKRSKDTEKEIYHLLSVFFIRNIDFL